MCVCVCVNMICPGVACLDVGVACLNVGVACVNVCMCMCTCMCDHVGKSEGYVCIKTLHSFVPNT